MAKNKEVTLINQRKSAIQSIEAIQNYVTTKFNPEEHSIELINVRANQLDVVWSNFLDKQDKLEELQPETDQEVRTSTEEMYLDTKAMLHHYQKKDHEKSIKYTETVISDSQANSNTTKLKINLPKFNIPIFEGKYEQWRGFFDVFTSVIHNSTEITNIEKFFYLKASLKGEALKIIEAVPVAEQNYEVALKLLTDRFDNESVIINAHLKALFEMLPVAKETTQSLRNLLSETKLHLRSLQALNAPTEHWDLIIIYLVSQKLDSSTRRAWELHKSCEKMPTLDEFYKFLEHRCSSLEAITQQDKYSSKTSPRTKSHTSLVTANFVTSNKLVCKICKNNHHLFHCEKFKNMNIDDRMESVKNNKLCFNCLKPNHNAVSCRSSKCRSCGQSHNTLLHRQMQTNTLSPVLNSSTPSTDAGSTNISKPSTEGTALFNSATCWQFLLATISVQVQDSHGHWHKARALLDSASQLNFISARLIKQLNTKSDKTDVKLTGIQNIKSQANQSTTLNIASLNNQFQRILEFVVLEEITCLLPNKYIIYDSWNIPQNITFADPEFNKPGPVDLLIGADVFFEALNSNQIKLGTGLPVLQDTVFGWIISGPIKFATNQRASNNVSMFVGTLDTEQDLEKFWKLEEVSPKPILTKEEKECEEHFQETIKRDNSGRYIVTLPLKMSPEVLGESYDLAKARFLTLERRLKTNPKLRNQYYEFMAEYRDLKHMEPAMEQIESNVVYHIPHHAVLKDSSSTTKCRVVFDASMKTTNQVSLNDLLKVGPTVYQDILAIIIRFRLHEYAFTADIQKMYRQVLVNPEQTNLQTIMWYNEDYSDTQLYKLRTVTYGTASAPYLATRCLQQLALDDGDKYPAAKAVLQNDFYVDDVMTGSNNLSDALELQNQLRELLSQGGFTLHKWCSNTNEILEKISEDQRETQLPLEIGKNSVKTLGLRWMPAEDSFRIIINLKDTNMATYTKRIILSEMASIFDPLGFVSPVIIRAKLIMQRLWREKIDWDSPLSSEISSEWFVFTNELRQLGNLQINRRITTFSSDKITYEIHGFCDASMSAYGACIYVKSFNDTDVSVNIMCAKSKVAPLKLTTIPRLELCGAVLLSRLIDKTMKSLQLKQVSVYLWTDSTIVLHWVAAEPTKWKPFIANRVAEIQEVTQNYKWNHVSTDDNPADLVSRGMSVDELQASTMWWHGPKWLQNSSNTWQTVELNPFNHEDLEARENVHASLAATRKFNIFDKYSSFTKLVRIFAHCLRFINNIKTKSIKRVGWLTTEELRNSTNTLIKLAQAEDLMDDIKAIRTNKVLKNSALKSLYPFIDSEGLVRVGGRLENLNIAFDKKHPVILPKGHKLTLLLIKHEHLTLLHAGTQAVLNSLRERYWPIQGRKTIKKLIHECVTCFKFKSTQVNQLMGNIPTYRADTIKAFHNTGVDYGGPFLLKQSDRKNAPIIKGYIALFICMSTRAIHLELVTSLSSEAFMNALKRFIARRGKCATIYSDNGTNFKGASRELKQLYKQIRNNEWQESIVNKMANEGISWKFIPPNSPHFGGIWEAGIKSAKHHIKRVIGKTPLTWEQFYTLLTQVEACVNSRPLSPQSDDPNDYSVLTPGHFLVGSSLSSVPELNFSDTPENRLSKWQLVQKRTQTFWKQWSRDYLHTMQQRNKWSTILPNIKVGIMVLIKDDNLPPTQWQLGRIHQVHPGQDKLVRVVSVRTSTGVLKRPITKLCVLPSVEGDPSRGAEC